MKFLVSNNWGKVLAITADRFNTNIGFLNFFDENDRVVAAFTDWTSVAEDGIVEDVSSPLPQASEVPWPPESKVVDNLERSVLE
jgi:hypothetical protein